MQCGENAHVPISVLPPIWMPPIWGYGRRKGEMNRQDLINANMVANGKHFACGHGEKRTVVWPWCDVRAALSAQREPRLSPWL